MKENELKHFVESTLHYFEAATGEAAKLGLPYVKIPNEDISADYTGIIGISGERKGGIYVSCHRGMLNDLAGFVTGIKGDADEDLIRDMAGELANTISGNATKAFGRNFHISTPIIIEGKPKSVIIQLEAPSYVIPAEWKGHKLHIVVGITD